jgi:tetratricopeptide (TPR) repeat protein
MRLAPRLLAIAFIVVLAYVPGSVRAQTPDDIAVFAAANQLYDDAEYSRAASLYERLAALGYDDPVLYYNLGNAYYKQGDFGRAVLSYRRAQRLAPEDRDLAANLNLARQQVADMIVPPDPSGPLVILANALSYISFGRLAAAALAMWTAVGAAATWALLARGQRRRSFALRTLAVAAALLALSLLALAGRVQQIAAFEDTAVVVAESVEVLSGPGQQYVAEFTLHGGAEADLVETRGNWSRISIPAADLQGWVPSSAVEQIVPPAS